MIQEKIYQPLIIKCEKCGSINKIFIPYILNSCSSTEELYIKDRIEPNFKTCGCGGIYNKCIEEYQKMNSSYTVNH